MSEKGGIHITQVEYTELKWNTHNSSGYTHNSRGKLMGEKVCGNELCLYVLPKNFIGIFVVFTL